MRSPLLGFARRSPRAPSLAQNAKLDAALSNSWWGHVPIMLAVDKGYFKELGIEVEVKLILDSADRVPRRDVRLGRASAISAGSRSSREMANDNKTFYFFANVDDSPGNEGCWARPGFASFKDLKGKKVAANTSAQITMNGLLENEGMTEKDVQFVNLPGGEMAGAHRARRCRRGLRVGAAVHQCEERRARGQAARASTATRRLQEVRHRRRRPTS